MKNKVVSNELVLQAMTHELRALKLIDPDTSVVKLLRVPEGWDIALQKE